MAKEKRIAYRIGIKPMTFDSKDGPSFTPTTDRDKAMLALIQLIQHNSTEEIEEHRGERWMITSLTPEGLKQSAFAGELEWISMHVDEFPVIDEQFAEHAMEKEQKELGLREFVTISSKAYPKILEELKQRGRIKIVKVKS